jgi:hypothetical protein
MRKSLKIASAVVVLFLALSAVAFVYAGMQNSLALADEQQTGNQNLQTFFDSNNITLPSNCTWPGHMERGHGRRMMGDGLQLVQMLSENATLSTVQGTIVSQTRDILILDTGSGQVRVMIPSEWTVGSEVVSGATLFNATFANTGQTLTVDVLKSDLFSNANFSVNVMLGYEAVNAAGTHAYAVLPFNIQPAS